MLRQQSTQTLQIDNIRGTEGIWLFTVDGQPALREGHVNDRANHQTVIFLELVSFVMGVVSMQVQAIDRSRAKTSMSWPCAEGEPVPLQ